MKIHLRRAMQWIFEPSCQVWYECGPPWSGECCITVQQTEITDKRARESAELGTRTWLSIYHWVMRQELQMCDNNFIVCSLLLIGLLSDQSESLLLFFIKWIVKSSSSCHQGKYSYKWNMCNNFGDFGMALGFDSITPFCKSPVRPNRVIWWCHFSIKPFTDVYKIYDVSNARRIGAGGFGKVYLIREKNSKKKHAAKYQKLTSNKLKEIVQPNTK